MTAHRGLPGTGSDQRRLAPQVDGRRAQVVPGDETEHAGPEDETPDRGLVHHTILSPQKSNRRRTRTPTKVPAKAIGNHNQPCTLPVEMPLSKAPMLQPKARREL